MARVYFFIISSLIVVSLNAQIRLYPEITIGGGVSLTQNTILPELVPAYEALRLVVNATSSDNFTSEEWIERLGVSRNSSVQLVPMVNLRLLLGENGILFVEGTYGLSQFSPQATAYHFSAGFNPIIEIDYDMRLKALATVRLKYDRGFGKDYLIALTNVGDTREERREFRRVLETFFAPDFSLGREQAWLFTLGVEFEKDLGSAGVSAVTAFEYRNDITRPETRPAGGSFGGFEFSLGLRWKVGR